MAVKKFEERREVVGSHRPEGFREIKPWRPKNKTDLPYLQLANTQVEVLWTSLVAGIERIQVNRIMQRERQIQSGPSCLKKQVAGFGILQQPLQFLKRPR